MLLPRIALIFIFLVSMPVPSIGGERNADSERSNSSERNSSSTTVTIDVANGTSPILDNINSDFNQKLIPHQLDIQQFSKEFASWTKSKTIQQRSKQTIRIIPGKDNQGFIWQLSSTPLFNNNLIASGLIPPPTAQKGSNMVVDIFPYSLPITPPEQAQQYYLRVSDYSGKLSNSVQITYQADQSQTTFTELGLNPHALDPMRIFVDLSQFKIIDSDEGSEEPYLINILIAFDGSTVDLYNIPNSTARVFSNPNTHDNIPRYNSDIGTGSQVAIPDETGKFVFSVAPLNPGLVGPHVLPFSNETTYIYPQTLDSATRFLLISIAMEEDGLSDMAVQSATNAMISSLRKKLNNAIQNIQFNQLMDIIADPNSFDPYSLVPRPNESLCASYEEVLMQSPPWLDCRPGWQQMQDDVFEYGKEVAKDIEISSGNIFQMIASAVDPDDQIGLEILEFSLDDIRNATQPTPITLNYKTVKKSKAAPEIPDNTIHYRVTGKFGRCVSKDKKVACVPYYSGIYYDGVWVPGTGPSIP